MKKVVLIFPKDSEAVFNNESNATFGGATVQIYLIAREMSNYKEIKTYSFINDYPDISFDEEERFNLIRTFKDTDNLLKKILIFHKKIKEIRPDVVIQRGLTSYSCLLSLYCRLRNIKFIFMFAHDREANARYQRTNKRCWLYRLLLTYSYLLVFQSQNQFNQIANKYRSKCKIIYSGYEIEEIDKKASDIILWVGRIEVWKRPELFLELAKMHSEKRFLMIAPESQGNSGLSEEIIRKTESIKNLDFLKFVHFHEIDEYFKKAYIFVNTSLQEGFPNTFIQACKNGTPIVSLNVNPDNFLNRYSCGFYCEDDFDLMNENLNRILNDDELYESMSENGRHYALHNHDIKNNVRKLVELIN